MEVSIIKLKEFLQIIDQNSVVQLAEEIYNDEGYFVGGLIYLRVPAKDIDAGYLNREISSIEFGEKRITIYLKEE